MTSPEMLHNRVRSRRLERGWSQEQLAKAAVISRAAVSAIEISRLVPSVAAALSLASALGCRVEELFQVSGAEPAEPEWAWPPTKESCRFWQASVAGRTLRYPVEETGLGLVGHDGVFEGGGIRVRGASLAEQTLVMASCDPAAGLLASELARTTPFRLLVLPRSSQQALSLLGQGLVHVAGLHLADAADRAGNPSAVQQRLGGGFALLRVARWEEGLALSPGLRLRSVRSALSTRLRWIGRETGSGARQCLDELLGTRPSPRRLAHNHRGVADAVRCGWADVGVCLRLVSDEAGLDFLSVRQETYDLCYAQAAEHDPRIEALIEVVRSPAYRGLLGELPGYDATDTGTRQNVNVRVP